ncbi:MAG: fructosamine kinase family protein [Cyclobacteriaceae bacterium]
MIDKSTIQSILEKELGGCELHQTTSVGGGCIHNGFKLQTSKGQYFLKSNVSAFGMFETEAAGLNILSQNSEITIPKVVGFGKEAGIDYLLMSFIEAGLQSEKYWENLGVKLAQMHRVTQPTFGLEHDNFIGSLDQYNDPNKDWIDFFIQNRLKVQLELAKANSFMDVSILNNFDQLFDKLPDLLTLEPPALLHGDLWSGNVIVDSEGEACIIDPAVYFGHREIELAFTTMFGGFSTEFYQSYQEAYPMEPGYEERFEIYNLYPSLVHLNLFGTSYLAGIKATLKKFC